MCVWAREGAGGRTWMEAILGRLRLACARGGLQRLHS